MLFACVRFKSLTFQEIGNKYLDVVDMPWTEFAGNPDIFAASEPIDLVVSDYGESGLITSGTNTMGGRALWRMVETPSIMGPSPCRSSSRLPCHTDAYIERRQ